MTSQSNKVDIIYIICFVVFVVGGGLISPDVGMVDSIILN